MAINEKLYKKYEDGRKEVINPITDASAVTYGDTTLDQGMKYSMYYEDGEETEEEEIVSYDEFNRNITTINEKIKDNSGDITNLKKDFDELASRLSDDVKNYDYGVKPLKGDYVRGTILASDGSILSEGFQHRVSTKNIMMYSEELTLHNTDTNTYRFLYYTYNEDGSKLANQTVYDEYFYVPKNTRFRICVTKKTETPSEIANLDVMRMVVTIQTNTSKSLDALAKNKLGTGKILSTQAEVSGVYASFDTLPLNSVVTYTTDALKALENVPVNYGCTIITVPPTYSTTGCIQLLITLNGDEICTRANKGTWTAWNHVGDYVFYVGSTRRGAKTFTTLKAVCEHIQNNNIIGAKVYIDAETFDLVNEYGMDYLNNIHSTTNKGFGLHIGNDTHFIFKEGAKVVYNYTGNNMDCVDYFSAFNVYGSVILENADVWVQNARYCVHEDLPTSADVIPNDCTVKYINCHMEHNGDTVPYESHSHHGYCAIGGGCNQNTLSVVDGGSYKSPWYPISYHNYDGDKESKIILKNTMLNKELRLQDMHGSHVNVFVSACKIPNGIVGTHTHFTINEWCNDVSA